MNNEILIATKNQFSIDKNVINLANKRKDEVVTVYLILQVFHSIKSTIEENTNQETFDNLVMMKHPDLNKEISKIEKDNKNLDSNFNV